MALLIFGPFANAATGLKVNELPQTNTIVDNDRFVMEIISQGTNGAMTVENTNVLVSLRNYPNYYFWPGAPSIITPEIRLDPITLLPTWCRVYVDDEFITYGASIASTYSSGGFSTAGGATAQQIVNPNTLPRFDRNGFGRLITTATNGIGGTQYALLGYQVNTETFTFQTNHVWESIVGFEDNMASNIVQMGLLDNITTTNQTTSFIGWEWNPQFYGRSNWIFRTTRAGSSLLYTSTFPITLGTTWTKLAWKGNTNSIIAYTNGVACTTNSTLVPGGTNILFFPAIQMLNGLTNGVVAGNAMTHTLYIDSVKFYRE